MDTFQFTQALRYARAEDRVRDKAFRRHAHGLRAKFGVTDVKMAHDERPEFVNYIDLIRVEHGLDEALAELNRYRDVGLMPALFALTILQITRRSGDFGRSEELLKEASEDAPGDDYVQQQYLQSVLANGNLRQLTISLDQVLLRDMSRMNPANRLRYAELAASGGSWMHVTRLLSDKLDALPAGESQALLRARADLGTRYEASGSRGFAVYVINLFEDHRKLGLVRKLFGLMGVDVERHDAVNGRSLSNYVVDAALAANVSRVDFGQGAVACALSHIAIWEKIASGGNAHALVLEDDAAPYSWRGIRSLVSGAGDFDILYVNDRMSSIHTGVIDLGIRDIWKVLEAWPQGRQGWGMDGYILSKRGAEKLLQAVYHDKISGHVDHQVGAYGIVKGATPLNSTQAFGLSIRGAAESKIFVKAVALNFPLTTQLNFGYSSIRTVSRDAR
jgi:hypothetical protein